MNYVIKGTSIPGFRLTIRNVNRDGQTLSANTNASFRLTIRNVNNSLTYIQFC